MEQNLPNGIPTVKFFGEFLRMKKLEFGYSSNGIAQAVGTSPSVIGCIEKGEYPGLKAAMMGKILASLSTSWEEFGRFVAEQEKITLGGGGQ